MENEQRIVELLAETLIKFDQMIDEQKQTNQRLEKVEHISSSMEHSLISMDNQLEKLEKGMSKLNLQTAENSRATFKLANEIENIAHLHERVTKLEKAVYK
ncbi:MAG: hypothetical protein IM574_01515 [Cytophagales bacterium]|jgi:hypothetical protein|nr:hypothetical protein [Cytophagales bacterium]MCA6387825.1 hypothetical protein [Cytophagales bacterium]MCA6391885.1 hypothetical protein [Cytophagales bacterium]MCA6396272.1 hypothetical protein [Cytophagales bacterium]MCA6399731.1 hypothetical protein [Cytophagales bacterium]